MFFSEFTKFFKLWFKFCRLLSDSVSCVCVLKEQEKGEQEKELVLQDEISSRVWVCTSTHSSTKVMVLDASQPSDLLDSFYACNTHVVCIASVPGRLSGHMVSLCGLSFSTTTA